MIRFEGRPVAFANLLETHSHELASLDLMRAHPEAPKLTMEFMMVGLIQHYKNHDYARFSLGMVPLSGLQPRRGAPLTQRLGSMVFRRGEQLYNFQGCAASKTNSSLTGNLVTWPCPPDSIRWWRWPIPPP